MPDACLERILVANDDGIAGANLAVLETVAQVVTQGEICVTPLQFDRTAISLRELMHTAL